MRLIFVSLLVLLFSVGYAKKEEDFVDIYMMVDYKYRETPSNIYPNKSLNVKIEGDNQDWFPFYNNEILGFEYEEGYIYKILVKRTHLKNPPQDGSSYKYELIRIINKYKYI